LQTAQSFSGSLRDLPVVFLCKKIGLPVVLHCHGGNFNSLFSLKDSIGYKIANYIYNNSTKIIILSDNLKSMFIHNESILSKCICIPNGISVRHFDLVPKVLDSKVRILFLSNLIEDKGYIDLIEAIKILTIKNRYKIELHIAGAIIPNSRKTSYQSKIDDLILKNKIINVFYHGVLVDDDKWALLENSDIFILPTYYSNEGQPLSIIEAMAFGLPVITTNFRGIPSLIEHKITGLFVEPQQPIDIANKIDMLYDNSLLFDSIRKNAFIKYKKCFTNDIHVQSITEVLKS
jgi:glycosyltransferase involved in cell wall biosynthesis